MQLPVDAIVDELSKDCQTGAARIVIKAPTGSGKSTRVPSVVQKAIDGRVLVVQPRRMAATLLARFVAQQSGEKLGEGVGYAVRFDSRYKKESKIVFVTDGVLMRMLQSDPNLSEFSAIVFDEFHERRLSSDVALAHCVDIQQKGREDLCLIVMSATLEVDAITGYLGDCRIHEVAGRTFPVDISFVSPPLIKQGHGSQRGRAVWEQVSTACKKVIGDPDAGNILIFLPGVFEIRRTIRELECASWLKGWKIVPLYGSLPVDQQEAAVAIEDVPKIVVSTNVAETSLTIPGVRTVIDSGLARVARFDPRRGFNALLVEPISQAAAEQRAGRAGRVAPGRCIRLWSQSNHAKRSEFEDPEVHRVELSETVLHLLADGKDPKDFAWVEMPKEDSLRQALSLLQELGAIDEEAKITKLGAEMARLPLEPRLARLLVEGKKLGCVNEALFMAAALQAESLFLRKRTAAQIEHFQMDTDCSDFVAEWRAWVEAVRCRYDRDKCSRLGIMARVAREWTMTIQQLAQHSSLRLSKNPEINLEYREESLARVMLSVFSDRLASRVSRASLSSRLVGRRRGVLDADSMARHSPVFIACEVAEVAGKSLDVKLSRCVGIDFEDLQSFAPEGFHTESKVEFDPVKKKVSALKRRMFKDLVLEEEEDTQIDPAQISAVLASAVMNRQITWNGWNDAAEQWAARVNLLNEHMPEMEFSPIREEEKHLLLEQSFQGVSSYKEIKKRTLEKAMNDWLSVSQQQVLDAYAPVTIKLSNGANAKLRYEEDGSVRIKMRVQQLYGVEETPTILDGRKKVLAEILAPNQRPWQITDDLAGFWKSGFLQMRKDLAGRYPKHDWRS